MSLDKNEKSTSNFTALLPIFLLLSLSFSFGEQKKTDAFQGNGQRFRGKKAKAPITLILLLVSLFS